MLDVFLVASTLLLWSVACRMSAAMLARGEDRSRQARLAQPIPVKGRLDHETVASLQILLSCAGMDPGPIDGRMGRWTVRALQRFLKSQPTLDPGPADGFLGKRTAKALQAWLTTGGYYKGPISGDVTKSTIESLQRMINAWVHPDPNPDPSLPTFPVHATVATGHVHAKVTGTPVTTAFPARAGEPAAIVTGTPVTAS